MARQRPPRITIDGAEAAKYIGVAKVKLRQLERHIRRSGRRRLAAIIDYASARATIIAYAKGEFFTRAGEISITGKAAIKPGNIFQFDDIRSAQTFSSWKLRSDPAFTPGTDVLEVSYDAAASQSIDSGAIPATALAGSISVSRLEIPAGANLVNKKVMDRVRDKEDSLPTSKPYELHTLINRITNRPNLFSTLSSLVTIDSAYDQISTDIYAEPTEVGARVSIGVLSLPLGKTSEGYFIFGTADTQVLVPVWGNSDPAFPGPNWAVDGAIFVNATQLSAIDYEASTTYAVSSTGLNDQDEVEIPVNFGAGSVFFKVDVVADVASFVYDRFEKGAAATSSFGSYANSSSKYLFKGSVSGEGPYTVTGTVYTDYVYVHEGSHSWVKLSPTYTDNRTQVLSGTGGFTDDLLEGRFARGYGPDSVMLVARYEYEVIRTFAPGGVGFGTTTYTKRMITVGTLGFNGTASFINHDSSFVKTVVHTGSNDGVTPTFSTGTLAGFGSNVYLNGTLTPTTSMTLSSATESSAVTQSVDSDWFLNEILPVNVGGSANVIDETISVSVINNDEFKTAFVDRNADDTPEIYVTKVNAVEYTGYEFSAGTTIQKLDDSANFTGGLIAPVLSGTENYVDASDTNGTVTADFIMGFNNFIPEQPVNPYAFYGGPIRGDLKPSSSPTMPVFWGKTDPGGNPLSFDCIVNDETDVGGNIEVGLYPPNLAGGSTIVAPLLDGVSDGVCITKQKAGYSAANTALFVLVGSGTATPAQISAAFDDLEDEIEVVYNNFAPKDLYVALSDRSALIFPPS